MELSGALTFLLLSAVFLLSALFFRAMLPEIRGGGRFFAALYIGLTAFLLTRTVTHYVDPQGIGSPAVAARDLVRVSQDGYVVSLEGESKGTFRFVGSFITDRDKKRPGGFWHPALRAGQEFEIAAKATPTGAVSGWHFTGSSIDLPVRNGLGGCLNLSPDNALKPGEPFYVISNGSYVSITRVAGGLFRGGSWTYSQGSWAGGPTPDGPEVRISGAGELQDAVSLSSWLAPAKLNRAWSTVSKKPLRLLDADLAGAVRKVLLVRARKGHPESEIAAMLRMPVDAQYEMRTQRVQPPKLAFEADLTPGDFTFGYGSDESCVNLKLPSTAPIWRGQHVLVAEINKAPSHILPPAQRDPLNKTLLLTSGLDQVLLDGYSFPTGNQNHPFYAKLAFDPDFLKGEIRDGLPPEMSSGNSGEMRAGVTAILGDYDQGIRVRVQYARVEARAGDMAVAAILLSGLLALIALYFPKRTLRVADIGWIAVWGIVLTLTAIRTVFAYRAALLPPLDAGPGELAAFSTTLKTALWMLWGTCMLPIVAFVARLREDAPEPREGGHAQTIRIGLLIWMLLPCAWIVAAKLVNSGGGNELFHVRTNIGMHLLWLVGMLFFARQMDLHREALKAQRNAEGRKHAFLILAGALAAALLLGLIGGLVWAVVPVIGALIWLGMPSFPYGRWGLPLFLTLAILPLLLVGALISDFGSMLYLLSMFLPVVLCVPLLHRMSLRSLVSVLGGLALLAVAAWQTRAIDRVVQEVPNLHSSAIYYRLAAFRDESKDLAEDPRHADSSFQEIYQNSLQIWQMRLNSATGAMKPVGYGGAALSKVGMTYPTSLSDCAFSTYILAENGRPAALLILIFIAGLGAVCIAGGLEAHKRSSFAFIPLLAIGGFFSFNALYMAAANVGAVPFTGQNVPFFGLDSRADAAQVLVLAAVAIWVLARPTPETESFEDADEESAGFKPYRRFGWAYYLGLSGLGLWLVANGMGALKESDREDYYFREAAFQAVEDQLAARAVYLEDSQIKLSPGAKLSPVVQRGVEDFRLRSDDAKQDPSLGLFFLATDDEGKQVLRVNQRAYYKQSPYRRLSAEPWTGKILGKTSSPDEPTLYMLSQPLSVRLGGAGGLRTIDIESDKPVVSSQSAILAVKTSPRPANPNERMYLVPFGQISRSGNNKAVFAAKEDPAHSAKNMRWHVYLEGKRLTDKGRAELHDGDILVLEDNRTQPPRQYNMIYRLAGGAELAAVRWRNDAFERIAPRSKDLPLLFVLGEAGDEVQAQKDLKLTVDMDLHTKLQKALADWCKGQPDFRNGDPVDPEAKTASMAVIDAFSGEVLAAPSWPAANPSTPEFKADYRKLKGRAQTRLITNYNFTNHIVGSSIKPLILAAVCSFFPKDIDSRTIKVYSHGPEPTSLGTISPLIPPTKGWSMPEQTYLQEYLFASYDWPAWVVGSLGFTDSPDKVWSQLKADRPRDLSIGGKDYGLDHLNADFQIVSKTPDHTVTSFCDETILFRGLRNLFGVKLGSDREHAQNVHDNVATFLPAFSTSTSRNQPYLLDNVVPQPVVFRSNSFRYVQTDLLQFLLGGNYAQWNNVVMAQSYARLVTGRQVTAHLDADSHQPALPMPFPLADIEWQKVHPAKQAGERTWRQWHILDALSQTLTRGTAVTMHWHPPAGYQVWLKSGTLGQEKRRVRKMVNGRMTTVTVVIPDSESLAIVLGRVRNGEPVDGQSVAAFFFLKHSNVNGFRKFQFADRVLPALMEHLRARAK